VAHVRAGNGENEINEHAAVEGKITDRGRLYDFADAGVDCVQYIGGGGVYLDNGGGGRELEREVEFELLAYFEANRASELREALCLNSKAVLSRQDSGDLEDALRICANVALCVSLIRSNCNHRTCNRTLLRIGDRAGHGGVIALAKYKWR